MTIRNLLFCVLIAMAIGALYVARQGSSPTCAAGRSPITDGTVYGCGR